MEISNNLNMDDWYTNSENNPNKYWPLDYPPMSGYHALIFGYLIKFFLPETINLKSSWGYESFKHKVFMRFTVILSDFIFFHIPVFLLLNHIFLKKNFLIIQKNPEKDNKNILKFIFTYIIILFSPCLNIIDHGHFQYNCVMHGLFYLSVYFLLNKNFILTIIFYSVCINFKQMGMYFSLTFLCFVLNNVFYTNSKIKNEENSKNIAKNIFYAFSKIIIYGISTIVINIILWFPWIKSGKISDIITRIFPIWRGVFEDKVKNLI